MKKYVFLLTAASAIISLSAKAQQDDVKAKEKHKPKEIIIREDKDKGKTTIVIDEDGKVTVDGKPSGDWDGGKVTIVPDRGDFFLDGQNLKFEKDFNNQVIRLKTLQGGFAFDQVRLGVYSAEDEKGAKVTRVTDSSAAFKAGLKEGDVITKVDNSPISNPDALSKTIREHKAGDVVTVHYLRGDREEQAKVTLEKPVETFKTFTYNVAPRINFGPGWFGRPRLGAHIQDTEDTTGVKVLTVNPESPAAKAGLQKDDVITTIDGKPVHDVEQAMDVLGDAGEKYNYPMTVTRNGATVTLQVKIPRDLKTGTL